MSVALNQIDFPDFDTFLSKTKKYSYPSNTLIFREGDISETLYFILSGSISVVLNDDDNREIIIAYLSSGDFLAK
jgi:CRP/FNR family cyclic AMP-dependent transcriptional regulator